jgi:hypothetical protein
LFEGGFEVFDDFLGENVGIRGILEVFEAFVSELEDVAAKKLACPRFLPLNKSIVMPDPKRPVVARGLGVT